MEEELRPVNLPAEETPSGGADPGAAPVEAKPGARASRPRRGRGRAAAAAPAAEAATPEPPAPEPVPESVPEAAPERAPEARPRRPRRRKGAPAASEAVPADAPADAIIPPAAVSAESVLEQLGERERVETGEPMPRARRGAAPPPVLRGEAILVPEALEEKPLPSFLEPDLDTPPPRAPILPITPELLAEVRAEEVRKARPPKPPRRPEQPQRPPRPVEPVLPYVLVPEALLETVPEDWATEDAAAEERVIPELLPEPVEGGRGRRRRRGRDRRGEEGRPSEAPLATVVAREVPPAERERDRREREARGEKEARAEREYKEILVNVGDRETRIAVLENGRLVELHVEREERVVGNVYKARVANVLPGMDAAFVDIGLERNAFLYVGDILFEDTSRTGSGEAPVRRTSRDVKIKDLAKPGQEILVQVVKGPRGTKGARVSTKISIPGRYLVLMPDGDHLGVSRKVEDARERDRLKKIADQLQPKGFGLIVRTEAEGRSEQELRQDLDYLVKTWATISEKNRRAHAPAVLHKDLGIILKTVRDLFGQDVDKLVIDDREEYEKAVEMLEELAPDLVDRVHLYEDREPLLIKYNVEEEIDRLLRRKVWLRNGAYLLIDTTEALTTIDVNTGKFVGTSSLAETILKTNLDAVDEIARQLRLRDIGGMIVLDFIDMASSRDRQMVMRALENAFRKDRTRIKIAHISPLGLVEMTRKRTSEAVTDVMSHTCPYCQGRGRVWSPETMAIQIEREIQRLCAKQEVDAVLVYANPEVAAQLIGAEGESVEQMERLIRRPVYIRARHDYHVEKYEIMPGDMMELERQMMQFHGGEVVDCLVTKNELITPPRSAAWADGYFVDVANGVKFQGERTRVRLTDVRRSFALGEPVAPSTAVDRSEPI